MHSNLARHLIESDMNQLLSVKTQERDGSNKLTLSNIEKRYEEVEVEDVERNEVGREKQEKMYLIK